MSADNYVLIKKFGNNDFRWAMFFASDEENHKKANWHKGFKTVLSASRNAMKECEYIEYGISYADNCLESCKKEIKKKMNNYWPVDITRYVKNTECPARIKRGKIYWCCEIDEKCCQEKCYGTNE